MAQLLAPISARRGGAPALVDELGETSWRELDRRVNRLIHALRERGLPVGARIGVLSGNRREYFELLWAAAHAGWVVVPIDWHLTAEEVGHVLEDSGARALVADARFAALAGSAVAGRDAVRIRLMTGDAGAPGFESYPVLLASGSPGEPAGQALGGVAFYACGTAGRPERVVGTASARPGDPLPALAGAIRGFRATFGIPADGVTLLAGPLYQPAQWAFSVFPLGCGSTVVMRQELDAAGTLELIDRYGVTNVYLAPSQFVRLLRLDPAARAAFSGSSLRVVWHGGVSCPRVVKRQMIDWWGPLISEYYGVPEGAVASVIDAEQWLRRPDSVGRPLDDIEVRVLDEQGRPCPPGQPGQICLGGRAGVDAGHPGATDHPNREPGLSTLGDVGYLDEEGFLHLTDRGIDRIVSAGVDIHPAQIEAVLAGHPQVRDAAVFGVPDEELGEQIKAAVELMDDCQPSDELADELIATCRERLAGYGAPHSVDFLDALPRHPNGRLYKRLLRDPYWEGHSRKI